jgi:hypothetical protein
MTGTDTEMTEVGDQKDLGMTGTDIEMTEGARTEGTGNIDQGQGADE